MVLDSRITPACRETVQRLGEHQYRWILRDVEEASSSDELMRAQRQWMVQRTGVVLKEEQVREVLIARQLTVAVYLSLPGVPAQYGALRNRINWAVEVMRQIGHATEMVSRVEHPRDAAAMALGQAFLERFGVGGRWVLAFDRDSEEVRAWHVPLLGDASLDSGPLAQVAPFRFKVPQ